MITELGNKNNDKNKKIKIIKRKRKRQPMTSFLLQVCPLDSLEAAMVDA